jgi:uncharacterized protein (TIGR02246 family)
MVLEDLHSDERAGLNSVSGPSRLARRCRVAVAGCVVGLVLQACAGGPMNPLEVDAIVAETKAFTEAMNAGDAALAASFYTEDGVRVGAFGDVQHGRAAVEAAYHRLLHQTMAGAQLSQERGTVRMLTADLAVWQGRLEILIPGSEEPLNGHVVQVMKKVGDRWLILEAHPKLFPRPPTSED